MKASLTKIKMNLSVLPAAAMVRTPQMQHLQMSSTLTVGGSLSSQAPVNEFKNGMANIDEYWIMPGLG
jgi:hypothetical protein